MGVPFPGPVPLYTNPPIQPQYYTPRVRVISGITLGRSTLVTTTTPMDYAIGQQVRLIIPPANGCRQLNQKTGFIINPTFNFSDLLTDTDGADTYTNNLLQDVVPYFPNATVVPGTVQIQIDKNNANQSNYSDNGAGSLYICSGSNSLISSSIDYSSGSFNFLFSNPPTTGLSVIAFFLYYKNLAPNSMYVGIDSSGFDPFVAASINENPQIVAIGDVNTGATNSNGINSTLTYIPGSFRNISPN